MTVLPVIERELRAQSRLALTYNLRVIGALAMLLAWLFYSSSHSMVRPLGGELFWHLNCTLFTSIWMLVPLLCADCISRERREGTVGLLFLTPLSARDVVVAKGLVHGVRAFSLLLTALPIITIAILLGGVSAKDAVLASIMNFSALCWALAAGLIASSLSKSWMRAQLLAFCLASGFCVIFFIAAGCNVFWFMLRPPISAAPPIDFDRIMLAGIIVATDFQGWWGQMLSRLPAAGKSSWLLVQSRMVLISLVFLALAIEIASRNLRRFWREEPPSARRVWLEQKLFTPILMVSFLRGWMRRKQERNPIGWLEQRTWSGRLVVWGWFAVMISLYGAAINQTDVSRSLDIIQQFMVWLLLGVIAVTAAGSFRRERETGLLELLLVSPMSVAQIIGGRLRGLWGQFLPAFIALLVIWGYLARIFPGEQAPSGLMEFFCGAFVALPVIGLYYSLRRPSFISAFLFTVFTGLAIPFGLTMIIGWATESISGSDILFLWVILLQLAIAAWIGRRLYHDMERRNFAFSQAVT